MTAWRKVLLMLSCTGIAACGSTVETTGRRPMNSGISPNDNRSSGSTCASVFESRAF